MEIIKFKPVFKRTIWGGEKIARLKHIDTDLTDIGETWEVSGIEGSESVACGGVYDGMTLPSIVRWRKGDLLGRDNFRRYGYEFPLLVKFIDARRDLSIQVHPDDKTARRHGGRRGKTEMWYVMESDAGARLYSGLRQWITPRQYEIMVDNHTICDALAQYEVREGDVFFLPAGRIHAIGAGCFIAEIQQACDITYRIYDYNRRDKDGNLRTLHTKKAAESIDYHVEPDYRTRYAPRKNTRVEIARCPYFTTALYDIDTALTLDYSALDAFVILVCVKGSGTIADSSGEEMPLIAGDTLLLPATVKCATVKGAVKLLETFA